ncbi:NADPH dehydrogenase, partial [Bacillus paralicheniformis]|nr:NADPH dehydrogenase [Bacillus paralicheniformis]
MDRIGIIEAKTYGRRKNLSNRKLFTPWSLKGVTLKNRIVMSPMCMYSSHEKDGKVQPFHMTHYISR